MPSIRPEAKRQAHPQENRLARWLTCLIVLTGFTQASHAGDVWMWIDGTGVTNYTQQKPRGIDATRIASSDIGRTDLQRKPQVEAPSRERRDPSLTADQQRTLDELQAQQKAEETKLATQKQSNCTAARSRLAGLVQNARVRLRDEDGNVRAISEAERQEKISAAQEQIARHCSGL